jgi:tetratricopeptide (TPR) repeat protein
MEEEIQKAEQGAKKAWPVVMSWVGGITALIGLFASLAGGFMWFVNHHKQKTELQAKMALAQAQTKQGEYQASIQSYADILKADPLYRPALDQELNTAMLWVEDFHFLAKDDQSAAEQAATALDQIMPILDSGLTRSKGSLAADIQAHIGWAHWLNQRIAEREFGSTAEQSLRDALASDPSNVYANAMLGNWMLQNGGSFPEAIQHLDIAGSTAKARPYVRTLQLGGLINLDRKGARAELVKVANDMRNAGESLDKGTKRHIVNFCFDPIITNHEELAESLTAIPPDEAWKTYLWLDENQVGGQGQSEVHDFIYANLLELSGKRQESLEKYRVLQKQMTNQSFTMKESINAAIARLSHN